MARIKAGEKRRQFHVADNQKRSIIQCRTGSDGNYGCTKPVELRWIGGDCGLGAEKILFAEDEVLQVWADAENLVESNLEELVHAELTRQWKHERLHRRWKERTLESNEYNSTF